jgi:hypothetical protein
MKVERLVVTGCCGKKQVVFKIDRPLTVSLLEVLKNNGFTEHAHFTKAGMLYVDNQALIISGPIGIDKLNVKCKQENCDQFLNDFEGLLIRTG